MTDVALDLAHYLRTTGLTNPTFAWLKTADLDDPAIATLYVDSLPDTPDSAMVVTVYSGKPPDETFGNPFQTRYPRAQFLVRDPDSGVARQRCEDVMKLLGRLKDFVINGTTYQRIKPVGEPQEIGPDSSDRQRATLNVEAAFYDS